jgi:predicted phage tail component-like protein
MNYVVLNGYRSTLIKGLLISELPPITKPMQRTSIEEIDGRDGDIITKLGYAAYDKKMTIGCYGDFNIDDIVQYFNSEGEVVFSNEPDKYYKYVILNQIDFERLCRFKTANVVFHVQPFKFSSVDEEMVFENPSYDWVSIRNNGNVISRPTIKIEGSGTIALTLHDVQEFTLTLGTNDNIILDGVSLNAYTESAGGYRSLYNRHVVGNMKNLWLPIGTSTIEWSGTVTKISVKDSSRWI